MNTIQSLNNNYNKSYQPAFKGTVDKKVINIVNQGVNNSIKTEIFQANIFEQRVKNENIKPFTDLRIQTLKALNNYMKKLHPDTTLTTDGKKFFLKNSKLNTKINFANGSPFGNIFIKDNKSININDPANKIIKECDSKTFWKEGIISDNVQDIKGLADTLERSVEPKALDRAMFYQFTDRIAENTKDNTIYGALKLCKNSEIVNKLAPEFGVK